MKRNTLFIVPALFAVLLLFSGCIAPPAGQQADVELEASILPQFPHHGDVVSAEIVLNNNGEKNVSGSFVELSVDGVVVSREAVSLNAMSSKQYTLHWFPPSKGDYDVEVVFDSANLVDETNESNNKASFTVSVLESGNASLFSHVPGDAVSKVYQVDLNREGFNQIAGIYASAEPAPQNTFYAGLVDTVSEAKLGVVYYNDYSEATILYIKTSLADNEFSKALDTFAESYEANLTKSQVQANGKQLSVRSTKSGDETVCSWQEEGWRKVLIYKRPSSQTLILNWSFTNNQTCYGLLSEAYDPSPIEEKISQASALSSAVSLPVTNLLEIRAQSKEEVLYVKGYADNNSAFLTMLSNYSMFEDYCSGTIYPGEDNKTSTCLTPASLAGRIDLQSMQRKQDGYSVATFIVPFDSTDYGQSISSARDYTESIRFSNSSDTPWNTEPPQTGPKPQCRFDYDLWCPGYSFKNSTLYLNLSHTHEYPIRVDAFKCQQDDSFPYWNFQLDEPITIQPNETAELEFPCYISGNETITGNAYYLTANLFINYTTIDDGEYYVQIGDLKIVNPEGA